MNVNPFSYLIEKLKGKVDKSGDTMSGILKIDQQNGTVSTEGYSYIHLGNSTPTGTDKNSTGSIRLFASSGKYANIVAGNLTANRAIAFPDNGGTVALTSDLATYAKFEHKKVDNANDVTFQVPKVDRGIFLIVTRLGVLVISEKSDGAIESFVPLGTITYTDNGNNSVTVGTAAYYRGASLVQLC